MTPTTRTWLLLATLLCSACTNGEQGGAADLRPPQSTELAAVDGRPFSITADATHVYWIEIQQTAPFPTTLRRMPRAGGAIEVLQTFDGGFDGFVLDGADVYFANRAELFRMRKDGTELASIRTGINGAAFGVVEGVAFWSDGLQLFTGPAAGTDRTPLATSEVQAGIVAVSADASSVYWIENDTGRILGVDRAGGSVRVLATEACPSDVRVEGDRVYWLQRNDCNTTNDFRLQAIDTQGATPLVTIAPSVSAYAVHDGDAYWSDFHSGLSRTGTAADVALGEVGDLVCTHVSGAFSCTTPTSLFADDRDLYFTGFREGPTDRGGFLGRLPQP